jgi:hypothetical protein
MNGVAASHDLNGLIQMAGYDRARLRFMKLIVRCALDSLAHAESKLADEWIVFCRKQGALRKPKASRRSSTRAPAARPDENAVTYELAYHIDEFLKALPSDHEYRDVNFRFEKPKRSQRLAGAKLKRLDLQYEARYPQGPEFVIEAKPLFAHSDIQSRYLGEPGLGRFLREQEPFTEGDLAGLMGYVVQHELDDWNGKIKVAVTNDTRCEAMVTVSPVPWPQEMYSTRHTRHAINRPIWMLHLLLTYPQITEGV